MVTSNPISSHRLCVRKALCAMNHQRLFKKYSPIQLAAGVILLLVLLMAIYMVAAHLSSRVSLPTGAQTARTFNMLEKPYEAPPFSVSSGAFLNASPQFFSTLENKLILVYFWTHTDIASLHALTHVSTWYDRYHDQGLAIIGVHEPQYKFEADPLNIQQAISYFNIHFPVLMDNNAHNWDAFGVQQKPAFYLIDPQRLVVYSHAGDNAYFAIENNIRALLRIPGPTPKDNSPPAHNPDEDTPDILFGYHHSDVYSGKTDFENDVVGDFHPVYYIPLNHWTLEGKWTIRADSIVSEENKSSVRINFKARKVYLIMGPQDNKPQTIKISMNDTPLGYQAGKDVKDDTVVVDHYGIYEVINQHVLATSLIQLTTQAPKIELYSVVFGD